MTYFFFAAPVIASIVLKRVGVLRNYFQVGLSLVGMMTAVAPIQARYCDDFYREEYSEREIAYLKYVAA